MEKLQNALETARKSRSGTLDKRTAAPAAPPRPRKAEGRRAGDPDGLWQALEPFEVDDAHLENRRIVTRAASNEGAHFDILRTKILLQMRQNGWKRLAITSPMPQSGKTTTACNLALGLGRQRDMRAILFDLDLRDPSVHDVLRIRPQISIGEVISGKADFSEQAMRFGDNIAVSMANTVENDPSRFLLAEETTQALDEIEARYQPDLMIFDLPSMLVTDDTRAFLKNVDCALIVARADTTRYAQFDVCEREITEQTNVLGVVLNAYRHAGRGVQ